MFLLAQLIGLAVIYAYHPVKMPVEINGTMQNVTTNPLPYGLEPPEVKPESSLISILFAFAIAFTILFFIMRLHKTYLVVLMRFWFFAVIAIALGIVINIFLRDYFINSAVISLLIGAFLSFIKVFRRNMILHNLTELAVYPGIAAIIVPILNLPTIIILLVVISVYDLWAVWHSGFMQKLANFQMKEVKVFGGFFVPYMTKKQRDKLKQARLSKSARVKGKIKSMKISLAILGGGDVVFPIITSGIVLRTFGFVPALIVIACSTIALAILFLFSQKGKFYPAMPFITAGLFAGIILGALAA